MKVAIIGGNLGEIRDTLRFRRRFRGFEVWDINHVHKVFAPPATRWFNLHHYAALKRDCPWLLANELGWARAHPKVPCYVLESWKGKLPNERIFPRAKLAKMPRGNYHCGTFDWLVAYAVLLGAKEIALYGVGLAFEGGEPMSAHACLEYWIGYATGKGVKVTNVDCDLFYNYRLVRDHKAYGYDDWDLVETVK